ncbi:MAG: hypothetical protein IJS37_05095 [Bacilli bacterium]|nr:hypothetical protein [Bacilli bacterium]
MKYSPTTRLMNVILCALLCFGFGYLAVYFGFLVTPFLWIGRGPIDLPTMGLALPLMLGAFGLAGALISLYGLFNSVVSIMKEKDDAPVVRTFGAYIAIGYLIAFFCLFNAIWLYRLTSTNIGYNEFAFVITVYAVLFFVALIVSNIPVLKLFGEHEELNKIMKIIDGSLTVSTLSIGVLFGVSYLVFNGSGDVANKALVLRNMGIAALIFLVAALLGCLAFLGYGKAAKANVTNKKNGLLFEGSLLLVGGAIIFAGVAEYLSQSGKNPASVSFVYKSTPNTNPNYMEFSIVAFVFGSLIVLAALYLMLNTLKGDKKAAR